MATVLTHGLQSLLRHGGFCRGMCSCKCACFGCQMFWAQLRLFVLCHIPKPQAIVGTSSGRPTCWCFNVAFDISKVVLRKLFGDRLMVDQGYSLLLVVPSKPGDDAFHWIMLVDKPWQIFTANSHSHAFCI